MKAKDGNATHGNLFVNVGGPGGASTSMIKQQDMYEQKGDIDLRQFSSELRAKYNIIALDLRGSGMSQPLYCDPHTFAEPQLLVPTTAATFDQLFQHNRKLALGCANLTGPLFQLTGTDQTIQDLEMLRCALGNVTFNYLGFSYGTFLAAQYAERYPHTLGRMVFDGNVGYSLSGPQAFFESATAVESTLEFFFKWCNTTEECKLHGEDQPAIWDALLEKADQGTLLKSPSLQCNSTPCQVQSEQFILKASRQMGSGNDPKPSRGAPDFFYLATALDLARRGNTSVYELGDPPPFNSSDKVPANSFLSTYCSDWRNTVRSDADMRVLSTAARAIAPRTRGISEEAIATSTCVGWPWEPTNPERMLNLAALKELPPIMLVNAFFDEATPSTWAVQQRWMIPSAFNIWRNGAGHTSYHFFADTQKAMDDFLVNGTIPEDGTIYMT